MPAAIEIISSLYARLTRVFHLLRITCPPLSIVEHVLNDRQMPCDKAMVAHLSGVYTQLNYLFC